MRDALNLASEFYGKLNLHIHDVRPTKLIEFESITSRFHVNVRLCEPAVGTWKVVFGQAQHRRPLLSIDISLFKGHCFYIQILDVPANHCECMGCQQRFSHHNHYNRHMTEKLCTADNLSLCAMMASSNTS